MKPPIDLSRVADGRYHIELDPAAECEQGGTKDPWYFTILCQYGHIYPYSDKLLAYYCAGPRIRERLQADHPELEVRQWSDDGEAVFLFTVDQFDLIASYAHPKRKRGRTISGSEGAVLANRGRDHRFSSDSTGQNDS